MLKRMLYGAVALGAFGVAFQLIWGLIKDSEPWWDTRLVVLMVLTGVAGGYFDHRRKARRDKGAKKST